jgi:predicted dehydrogenase
MPRVTRRRFLAAALASSSLSAAGWNRVAGANERVGVGFIGFGLIGKRHVLDFQQQQDASLVALCDVHQGRLDEGRALLGSSARGYRDFRELLDDRNVDAVVISTPDHWHALQTMLACAAEKDVYVEKPLTLFVREGQWMIDAARRAKRIVQVGMQQRSGPHYQRARELIRSGHIGAVVSVRMSAMRNILPGFGNPPDQPPPAELDWNMWLGPAPQRPYNPNRCLYHFRWFWDYSGGQMTNLGAHTLDIVDWYLAPGGPQAVTSSGGRFALQDNGETPDTQDALFEYSGLTATWSHRETAAGIKQAFPLEFFGTKGSLAISRTGFAVTPDKKIPPEDQVPQFTDRQPVGGVQRSNARRAEEYWTTALEDKTGDTREQLSNHVRNFLDCVKSRVAPIADLESAHRVATACHLANISLRLGRKIHWDAANEVPLDDAEASSCLVRPYSAPWDKELRALGVATG